MFAASASIAGCGGDTSDTPGSGGGPDGGSSTAASGISGSQSSASGGGASTSGSTGALVGAGGQSAGGTSSTGAQGETASSGAPSQSGSGGESATGGAGGEGATGGAGGCPASGCAGDEPPSCAPGGPGLTTCGPDGDESCCVSLPVMGGTFSRTYRNTGQGATGKADTATVSTFLLDKYEVTVGRFRQYVSYLASGGSPPAAGSGKHTHLNDGQGLADSARRGSYEPGWDEGWNRYIPSGPDAASRWNRNLKCNSYGTWTDSPGQNEELPLTCLNWVEAHAFCIWDGGFLPSEAEWKYAAAGGDEHRMYPWGSMDPGRDNQYAIYACYYPASARGTCTGTVNVPKVGSTPLGVGRWGHWDLSGSVWEWNLDRFANYVNPCTDCAYVTGSGTNRVLPGGGFHTPLMPYLLSSNRQAVSYHPTDYRGDYGVGVRCARAP